MRYIMHIERLGWVLFLSLEDIAENSYARPTKTSLEGNIALNQLAIGMIGKKGKYNCNAMPSFMLCQVWSLRGYKIARWLEVTHEGTSQVKGSRLTYLTREYGLLEMKSSEGIREMHTQFTHRSWREGHGTWSVWWSTKKNTTALKSSLSIKKNNDSISDDDEDILHW
jgi:hypothetical protein